MWLATLEKVLEHCPSGFQYKIGMTVSKARNVLELCPSGFQKRSTTVLATLEICSNTIQGSPKMSMTVLATLEMCSNIVQGSTKKNNEHDFSQR